MRLGLQGPELEVNQVLNRLRHLDWHCGRGSVKAPTRRVLNQNTLADQFLYHCDEKERIAMSALIQQVQPIIG